MTATGDPGGQRSLWRNRDFRRFFAGQFVTNAGDSLYTVAVLWLVFELSGSTVLTGVANSLLLLPWLLQILAGPVVDRLPLKPVLVGSQIAQGVVVLALPIADATGHLSVPFVLAVVPVLVVATLVMSPMQTTLLPRIVDDGRLSNANSALATVTLGLDMVFDALGGAFIAIFGATTLFLFDSVTFALAALCFAGITIPGDGDDEGTTGDATATGDGPDDEPDATAVGDGGTPDEEPGLLTSYVDDLRDGVAVLRGSVFVELVVLTAVANFATGVTLAILPAFGSDLGGPALYGLVLGALGIGRLVGSLLAPYVEDVPYGRFVVVANAVAAVCWLASVYAPSPLLTVVLFGLAWVAPGASGVLTATLNQTVFPQDLLGRVSAIKGTASGATLPLGSLVGGVVAQVVGVQTTMALAAGGFGFAAVYVLFRGRLRRLPAVVDADADDFDVVAPGRTTGDR